MLSFDLLQSLWDRLGSIGAPVVTAAAPGLSEDDGFENIHGIGPTIAVKQSIIRQSNPRSVVGTKTKLLTYLSMLFVHDGQMACSQCGTIVQHDLTCGHCGNVEERLTASYFSFNSPDGMCLQCQGKGFAFDLNMDVLVPTPQTTLRSPLTKRG